MRMRVSALAAAVSLALADDPVSVVRQSNVVWGDADWKPDGTGSMPIGNGDVTSSVFVDRDTSELVLLVGKGDVFDENSQPVRIGAVRLTFTPPLWTKPPAPVTPGTGTALARYAVSKQTIVEQTQQFAVPDGWKCSSKEKCPEESAELCDALGSECESFSLHPQWGGGVVPQLGHVRAGEKRSGTELWTMWAKNHTDPPGVFQQTLDLGSASVQIRTPGVNVTVFGEVGSNNVRVGVAAAAGKTVDVAVRVVPYRKNGRTNLGRALCKPRYDTADVVVAPGASRQQSVQNAVVWYHHNPDNSSYYRDNIENQGMDPASLPDPFSGLTFGAAIHGDGFALSSDGYSVAAKSLASGSVTITTAVQQTSEEEWQKGLASAVSASAAYGDAWDRSVGWWKAAWSRSYLNISAAGEESVSAKQVMDHAHWQRYLELVQGTQSKTPIKFNGQAFTANNTGKGWDYRDWGACYWWQNTRQPYYNSIAQGDTDVLHRMFEFYYRMLDYVKARTHAQFAGSESPITGDAAFFPETTTQFGTYNQGDWGCNSPVPRPHGASDDAYIRFHWTGNLELCLLFLDDMAASLEDSVFIEMGLPICSAVTNAFRQRWPHVDNKTGKTDMWPSQCLETYQCADPTSRETCPTNPVTDISGLTAVLTRMLKLPASIVPSDSPLRAQWAKQLSQLPPIIISGGEIQPAASGTPRRGNSENTILYPVHPFRMYGNGKPDIEIAQKTFKNRKSPCNDGWCQDVIDAALLNLTAEAKSMVAGRAAAGAAPGFRFGGFAAHYQDYEPSLDHYAFMRTAVNYMLISPLDDEDQGLLLFPTWPVDDWDVSFKMHGPRNTTVEAACVAGRLTHLSVDPPSRAQYVKVVNCRQ
eukprot:TRINITY_DN46809_c0_g1_i1.p1 TRINITY_DN46809_c0_g1~~TRINITY_DN46809_c0_g1_i1.p1  ORF type:complete len:868 (+),score=251.77 TRINITY_DN46809_c0_g1_i1:55-2658(+)